MKRLTFRSFIAGIVLMSFAISVHAAAPTDKDLDAAIAAGDFGGYFTNLSAFLGEKAAASQGDEAGLLAVLKDPAVAKALCQRQFLAKHGVSTVGEFARVDQDAKAFLGWLLRNTQAMDMYLEAVTPTKIRDREANAYTLHRGILELWKKIYLADPDSREGIYLRLAIAASFSPPPGVSSYSKIANDPVERYKYFKNAHKNKELFPSFDNLTVWEYSKVVNAMPSNEELTWAREMINTWRPDLRVKEQVVNVVSEVWRRNSPNPYADMKTMLQGGGKCGPRSTFGVMINQAFGIPAIGVGQPQHACVAYKTIDPASEPQPGNVWKVGYGRGWHVSKLDGMSGPEFVEGVESRARAAQFTKVEHLRWLASALTAKPQADAVMAVVQKIATSHTATKTDLTASEKAEEAEKEVKPEATAAAAGSVKPEAPIQVAAGTLHVEAEAFDKMDKALVFDCYTGGKQVNYMKSIDDSWVEYKVDVPAAGGYAMVMRTAAVNFDQRFDVSVNGEKQVSINVPLSFGLWATTPEVELKLQKGVQTIRISAPNQRGVAVRWFELKAK